MIKLTTSFFRFYYFVLMKNDKKYEITTDPTQKVSVLTTPVAIMFIYLFVSAFCFSPGFLYFSYLFIPFIIMNLMFLNKTSITGHEMRMKKLQDEIDEERIRQKEQQKILEEKLKNLYEQQMNQKMRNTYKPFDRNKANAIKLMGLNSDPSTEEIKSAYRKLSKVHHPDMGGMQENFIKLNKAYEYLMGLMQPANMKN